MDLSVVIRCGDDERVFRCIDSIDEDVEVIVSLSAEEDLQDKLEDAGVRYYLSPRKNLSRTSNIGFENASHNRVIMTDSDTTFERGCIRRLNDALDTHKVARAGIKFLVDSTVPFSYLVAEARDYINSLPLVYTPGIAVRKDILPDIGGFLFNDSVPYAVDADLNYRIRKAGIPVAWLTNEVFIRHSAENIKHDLNAAFRIGTGCRVSFENLRDYRQYSDIPRNALKGVRTRRIPDVFRKKGLGVGIYQILWDLYYYMGYTHQLLFRRYE